MPSSMMPYRYNNGVRIIQTPGYVVLDLEMIHESRIIPVDGRRREYACHEGNRTIGDCINTSRAERAAQQQKR